MENEKKWSNVKNQKKEERKRRKIRNAGLRPIEISVQRHGPVQYSPGTSFSPYPSKYA